MAAKLTRLTHKIAIQLHLVAERFTICSARSRWSVRNLLDTPSHNLRALSCGGMLYTVQPTLLLKSLQIPSQCDLSKS